MLTNRQHRGGGGEPSGAADVLARFRDSCVREWRNHPSRRHHPLPTLVDTVALPTDSAWFDVAMTLPEGLLPSAPPMVLAHRVRTHLAALDRPDLDTCDGPTLVGDLLLIEQIESFLHAAKAQRLAALTRPGVAGDPTALVERRLRENTMLSGLTPEQVQVVRDGETLLAAEQLAVAQVGSAMVIAPGTAARRVHEALDLAENLPETLIALGDGQLDHQRARVLADRSAVLSNELRNELERRLLAQAMSCTPRQWRALVDAEIIALDPDSAEQRRRDAVDRRTLRLEKLDDGIGRFLADLPAHQAQLAWDLFDAVAEKLRGLDDRTADQRRADAFVTIVEMLASGQTVSVADILSHPDLTRHDTCYRPEHPADLARDLRETTDPAAAPCPDCTAAAPSGPQKKSTSRAPATPPSAAATEPKGSATPADPTNPVPSAGYADSAATDNSTRAAGFRDRPGHQGAEDLVMAPGPASNTSTTDPDRPTAEGDRPNADPPAGEAGRAASDDSTTGGRSDDRPGQDSEAVGVVHGSPPDDVPQFTAGAALLGSKTGGHRAGQDQTCAQTGCGCGQWRLPTRQGRDTHTTVVLTLDALAGLAQDPALLAGHGTITAEFARALAETARSVNVLVVDGDGTVVGIGDRSYRPRQQLRDQITTAYPTCIFTGCHRPVDRSDFDHTDPFDRDQPERGGGTELDNLVPLCRHHHRLKTLGGWSYQPARSSADPLRGGMSTPAAFIFRSPLGLESVSRVDQVVRPRHDFPAPF